MALTAPRSQPRALGYQGGATPPASPVASPLASPVGDRGPGLIYTTGSVAIRIGPDGFEPEHVLYAVGINVTLVITNATSEPRTFSVDELGISIDLSPSETQEVELTELTLGNYSFHSEPIAGDSARFEGRITVFI
jgi:hypothetical protein